MGLSRCAAAQISARHFLESENPQTNNVILAKAETIPLPEIKYK